MSCASCAYEAPKPRFNIAWALPTGPQFLLVAAMMVLAAWGTEALLFGGLPTLVLFCGGNLLRQALEENRKFDLICSKIVEPVMDISVIVAIGGPLGALLLHIGGPVWGYIGLLSGWLIPAACVFWLFRHDRVVDFSWWMDFLIGQYGKEKRDRIAYFSASIAVSVLTGLAVWWSFGYVLVALFYGGGIMLMGVLGFVLRRR